jgi:predicted O-methyltransferase YrrM
MLSRERLYESVLTRLSPDKAAWLDQHRPSVRSSWGWGPLNGQAGRQQIVRDLAHVVDFDEVVETGTYRGNSTEFLAHVLGVPVLTVEGNPRFFHYSERRLAPYPDVTVEMGDSRSFLRRLAARPEDRTTLFYLDAHWQDDLPLHDEVQIIAARWDEAVIVIDDFEVPGDPGYTFDDYGPGKRLCVDYLPATEGWRLFFPALPAAQETGGRRGAAILASPALADAVGGLPTLRAHG